MEPGKRPASPASTYFRTPSPVWIVFSVVSLGWYSWLIFSPATFPYNYLGPLGICTSFVVENFKFYLNIGYFILWLVHALEMLYGLKLCRDKGITDPATQLRWAILMFLFGISALCLLMRYNPPRQKDQ